MLQHDHRSHVSRALAPTGPNADCHHLVKILLGGTSIDNNYSLLSSYASGMYVPPNGLMMGIEYQSKRVQLDGQLVLVQIWPVHTSTSHPPTVHYRQYEGATGLLITYDVTRPTAIHSARQWLQVDAGNAGVRERDASIVRLLLAVGVESAGRVVDRAAGKGLAAEYGVRYAEASIVTGAGVNEAFEWLAAEANERWKAAEARQADATETVTERGQVVQLQAPEAGGGAGGGAAHSRCSLG